MAAVSIPPSPQMSHITMSTRRPPLASVPNATNSPHHRPMVVPAKRSRHANNQLDIPYGQPPPKKQVVEGPEQDARSPAGAKPSACNAADSKLFSRRASNSQPSAFEKKLVAARDTEKQPQLKGSRHEKPPAETLDTIRQWQRHYRKAFPQFVFYFDSIPVDLRTKFARQVLALGAREEKFFSRLVTHVVTSRPIPPESAATGPTESNPASAEQPTADGFHTVNPSLLEKGANAPVLLKSETRREQGSNDVLHRARQMGMKVWALEKLQRMISTIHDGEISGHGHSTRSNNTGGANPRGKGENDLSQVLRNELVNGPSDMDPFSSNKEMIMFKGPFIYVHDLDERSKPVIVRDYPKVDRRQDGPWPQFRSAPIGKCPFVEEPLSKRGVRQRPRHQAKEKKPTCKPGPQSHARHQHVAEPTRVAVKGDPCEGDEKEDEPLYEQSASPEQPGAQKGPIKKDSPKRSSDSFIPPQVPRAGPFFLGREPAASGVQPSNVTSAIRSQMISSTAATHGAKAAVSKEVHELKRKVLEKGNGGVATGAARSRTADPAAGPKMTKGAIGGPVKTNAQEKPRHANREDTTHSEGNGATKRRFGNRNGHNPNEQRRRDPKPGYCENCREKFDDFEEHTQARKHRKFAMTTSNWAELDALLAQLERPLKGDYDYE